MYPKHPRTVNRTVTSPRPPPNCTASPSLSNATEACSALSKRQRRVQVPCCCWGLVMSSSKSASCVGSQLLCGGIWGG